MKIIAESVSFNESHDDEHVLRFLRSQIRSFINHLKEKYPNDELTRNLLAKYSDVQLLPFKRGSTPTTYTSGMFDHSSGTLKIAARDGGGIMRDEASLNKSIVHELAHGTRFKYPGETSHSSDWKTAWKKFLKIATEELYWKVEFPCSSVKFYGLQKDDCPFCIHDDEECVAKKTDLLR
ncbi:hypothetical protein PBCVNEJV1_645L [Paramecium bursaria Chlorella virus NE-JV-1]|nr:hypothetical protein PBCVNEJV1_645L [Paramecium bursaria Chlorella virus NE-JV-1]